MSRSNLPPPAPERVREVLAYDPETGVFMRRVNSRRRPHTMVPAGGRPSAQGYIVIHLDGRTYMAHRLAWLHAHGEWPPEDIDHINGVRTDNRLSNLRCASRAINMQNLRRPPISKRTKLPLGVQRLARLKSKPFVARIIVEGKPLHLGYFTTEEEAASAYLAAKRLHHQGCTI